MTDYTALIAHIEALNAEKQAWIDEDPSNRWAGMHPTDVEYFQDIGVSTPAEYNRYMDEETFYSMHRDAYHYRPSMEWIKSMTDEQLEEEIARAGKAIERELDEDRAREARNVASFEARVQQMLDVGAQTRADAIRWIVDSLDIGGQWDAGYVCYTLGLPYSMKEEFEAEIGDFLRQKRDDFFLSLEEF